MIQRIQSLLLLLAAILNAATLFLPLWSYGQGESREILSGMGVATTDGAQASSFMDQTFHLILFAGVIAVSLYLLSTIFFYKDRKRQIKLVTFGIVLLMLLIVGIVLVSMQGPYLLAGEVKSIAQYGFAAPILALILTWIARKRIHADEQLVRSVDRFR